MMYFFKLFFVAGFLAININASIATDIKNLQTISATPSKATYSYMIDQPSVPFFSLIKNALSLGEKEGASKAKKKIPMTAQFQMYNHEAIPFTAPGNGFSSDLSLASAGLKASYFKEFEKTPLLSTNTNAKAGVVSETKFSMMVPYLNQIKVFGGYSYQRTLDDRQTKGANFGFQANFLKYMNIDTTFVRKWQGKTATQVLFTFNMPTSHFKF